MFHILIFLVSKYFPQNEPCLCRVQIKATPFINTWCLYNYMYNLRYYMVSTLVRQPSVKLSKKQKGHYPTRLKKRFIS